MRSFEKNRPRLLVISKDLKIRNDLVALLTGYGYFVDYVETRSEGITKFRQNKHAVVIVDVHSLPKFPERMLKLFSYLQRNPIILIAAHKEDQQIVFPYLRCGVYDILPLPLQVENLDIIFRRMVNSNILRGHYEFSEMLIFVGLFSLPVWILFLIAFTRL